MKIKINDFSGGVREDKSEHLKGLNYAKNMENFDSADGSLRVVNNLSKFSGGYEPWSDELIDQIKSLDFSLGGKVFIYRRFDFDAVARDDKLIIFDSGNKGYYVSLCVKNPTLLSLDLEFSSSPVAINYRLNGEDVIMMSSEEDNLVVWNGKDSPEIILDAPKIKSMDLHYERLFAVVSGADGTELKFSDDLDPTNWSESLNDAGFIMLVDERGKLLKVLSFNDYLFVFREHGVTRVYANTSLQSNFYVNQLFVSGGRILGETIALCGDRVLFLSTDGFYLFDGAESRRCLENIFPKIKFNGKECASFFNGKYYLACHYNFGEVEDETENNALLVVTIDDLKVSVIRGLTPLSLAFFNSGEEARLVILNKSESLPLVEVNEKNSSAPLDFSSRYITSLADVVNGVEEKTLRRVVVKLKNPKKEELKFSIFNERGDRQEFFTQKEVLDERTLFSFRGVGFCVETSGKDLVVQSVELEI